VWGKTRASLQALIKTSERFAFPAGIFGGAPAAPYDTWPTTYIIGIYIRTTIHLYVYIPKCEAAAQVQPGYIPRVAFWRVACNAVATLMASFLKLYSGPYPIPTLAAAFMSVTFITLVLMTN